MPCPRNIWAESTQVFTICNTYSKVNNDYQHKLKFTDTLLLPGAVQEAIKAELQSLKTQLSEKDDQLERDRKSHAELQQEVAEKTEQLEKNRKRLGELQQELEEMQRVERGSRSRAYSFPNLDVKPMEDQVITHTHFAQTLLTRRHSPSPSSHPLSPPLALPPWASCSRVLQMQKLKFPLMRTLSCERFPCFKPGAGQYSFTCFVCCLEFVALISTFLVHSASFFFPPNPLQT